VKNALLFLFIVSSVLVKCQTTYVPDDNFEAYIESQGWGDGIENNDLVLTDSIAEVELLSIGANSINDYTGLKDFNNLEVLWTSYNGPTTSSILDVSGLMNLTHLECQSSGITNLLVSNNPSIREIRCSGNYNLEFDFSGAPNLEYVNLGHCNLTNLQLTHNPKMLVLIANNNKLKSIDISVNPLLERATLSNNNLSFIDLCSNPNLFTLSLRNNEISALDLSSSTAMKYLTLNENYLTDLDLSKNLELIMFNCDNNQISNLDLSMNTDLVDLKCQSNNLFCLNLQNNNNVNMTQLKMANNPLLTCVQVDENPYEGPNVSIDDQSYFSTSCDCVDEVECSNSLTCIHQTVCYGESYTSPSGLFTWDQTGSYSETLTNAGGCDSIITIELEVLSEQSTIDEVNSCGSYEWIDGNIYNSNNNTATFTYESANGCDSLVTLNLTVDAEASVTTDNNTITAINTDGTYQWINCNNGNQIEGETNQTFTPNSSGNYAVQITQNECTNTSDCVEMGKK